MNIKEIFNSQSKQSEKLVLELAGLEATWPAVKAEYDKVDTECIALAGRLNSEQMARSPRALQTQVELRQLRWRRDGIKQTFSQKRSAIHNQLVSLSQREIDNDCNELLSFVKALAAKRNVVNEEVVYVDDGTRQNRRIRVRHNLAAIGEARDNIFAAAKQLRSMQLCSIPQIQVKFKAYYQQFSNLDVETMETEDIPEMLYKDLQPQHESGNPQTAWPLPDGGLVTAGGIKDSISQVKELDGRLAVIKSKLKEGGRA